MTLKEIFEALDKGKGIQQQKALIALRQAVEDGKKLIDFEEFKNICDNADCYLQDCNSETCPKWNLL